MIPTFHFQLFTFLQGEKKYDGLIQIFVIRYYTNSVDGDEKICSVQLTIQAGNILTIDHGPKFKKTKELKNTIDISISI